MVINECENKSFIKSIVMKRGINKVTLMGNVGDDPRVNQINDTMKVARFPLATNEVYTDKDGKIQSSTWEDMDGIKRYSFEIKGDNFVFIIG